METLKKLQFIYWLIVILNTNIGLHGLQGIPTWICLGLKSPFLEFLTTDELLSNASVSLNDSTMERGLNKNNAGSLKNYIHPIELKNEIQKTTIDDFTVAKQSQSRGGSGGGVADPSQFYKPYSIKTTTENPIVADMNSKKEVTIIDIHDGDADGDNNNHNHEFTGDKEEINRKYIIPLALKNPTIEPPKKSQLFQNSSTNIDDLKRHILMLQNLTKNDQHFQSKFVVFPSLQRNSTITSTTQTTTELPTITTTVRSFLRLTNHRNKYNSNNPNNNNNNNNNNSQRPINLNRQSSSKSIRINTATQRIPPTPPPSLPQQPSSTIKTTTTMNGHNIEFDEPEEITMLPQVFLQNDQMLMNDDSFESGDVTSTTTNDDKKPMRINYNNNNNNQNKNKNRGHERKWSTTTTNRPRNRKKNRKGGTRNQPCLGSQINCQTRRRLNKKNRRTETADNNNMAKQRKISITDYEVNDGGNHKLEEQQQHDQPIDISNGSMKNDSNNKMTFNQHKKRDTTLKDVIYPNTINSTPAPTSIDLNPDLCYTVNGLSNGQQKLCTLHTEIMPAISRGARSAIQECRHQFKNRRWNCSTVEDDSVFGPISTIGSPEMAFVHALAAAGAASFVARACRDGQLTSCGCSRNARPNHLHEDWTWGGCGDDLEFGYKFTQNFIDIKEREKKRGARGLITVPPNNTKLNLNSLYGTNNNNDTDNNGTNSKINQTNEQEYSMNLNQEHFLELQEKITKEIFNSKLKESEMQDLQEKINKELLNSRVFSLQSNNYNKKAFQKNQRSGGSATDDIGFSQNRIKASMLTKARNLMNLHNNEAGRRAVIKKSKITCKCHGVSGSCSLITCWQQLSSMREIGDYLREKYDEATQVKMNKRGRLQVKDPSFKVPTALDLVYLDESPDFCQINRQLNWSGTHNRVCNKTSSGLDGCAILCCGRGYNTKKIIIKERCNCKFHWCCHVKCDICEKVIEEYICK